MSIAALENLDAINHIPNGGSLHLTAVDWDEYETLLAEWGDRPGRRVSYDTGRLEIMSPSPEHEESKEFIHSLARVISEESNVVLESRGSATFKQKDLLKGVEPDTCFYVQHALEIIGKREIDLAVDPPPDVVVEIDMTTDSFGKIRIFAAFEIAEIWRYDGHRAVMYQLADGTYAEMGSNLAFRGFTSTSLTQFIEQSKSQGQTVALAAFRTFWRSQVGG